MPRGSIRRDENEVFFGVFANAVKSQGLHSEHMGYWPQSPFRVK